MSLKSQSKEKNFLAEKKILQNTPYITKVNRESAIKIRDIFSFHFFPKKSIIFQNIHRKGFFLHRTAHDKPQPYITYLHQKKEFYFHVLLLLILTNSALDGLGPFSPNTEDKRRHVQRISYTFFLRCCQQTKY